MSRILKVDALNTMVEYINSNNYEAANEILKIISRSQVKDKKNNIISDYMELNSKKEEKYFKKELIINSNFPH